MTIWFLVCNKARIDLAPLLALDYFKPIALKFKINPKIPILVQFVNNIPTNFQPKILSPGVMAAFEALAKSFRNTKALFLIIIII